MRLILFGPPGSGKGTYALILEKKFGIPKINTGDIFREMIKKKSGLSEKVASYLLKGKLVPDEITIQVLKKRIAKEDCKNGFILDGYPRTIKQAEELEKILKIDAVINLVVPKEVIVKRLSGRLICPKCNAIYHKIFLKPKEDEICDKCKVKLIQREDDKPKVIRKRFEVYKEQSKPLIKYYREKLSFANVRCNKVDIPPEIVVERIIRALKKLKVLKN